MAKRLIASGLVAGAAGEECLDVCIESFAVHVTLLIGRRLQLHVHLHREAGQGDGHTPNGLCERGNFAVLENKLGCR